MSSIVLGNMVGDRHEAHRAINAARETATPSDLVCPDCRQPMLQITPQLGFSISTLGYCPICNWMWVPEGQIIRVHMPVKPEDEMSEKAREAMLKAQLELIGEEKANRPTDDYTYLQHFLGFFGLPVDDDDLSLYKFKGVLFFIMICLFVYFLIRKDLPAPLFTMGFLPEDWKAVFGLTALSSMILHVGVIHLLETLYFMLVFGGIVERWIGLERMFLIMVLGQVAGLTAHVLFSGDLSATIVGANQAITALLAFVTVAQPKRNINLMLFLNFSVHWLKIPIWAYFLLWIVVQFLVSGLPDGDDVLILSAWAQLGAAFVGITGGFWMKSDLQDIIEAETG